MTRARHSASGFTLAEVLVASILLSITMTAVYTLFYSAIGSWKSVERNFNAYQDARNVLTIISRELENNLPGANYLFEGKDDEFTFFTIAEPMNVEKAEGRHLMKVRYFLERGKDALMREEGVVKTALPKAPPVGQELDRSRIEVKNEETFMVASGIRDFEVRYVWIPVPENRDIAKPPTPAVPIRFKEHHDRWGYPQAVEIRLFFRDPDDKDRTLSVKACLPIRISAYRTKKQLQEMVGESK